MGTKNELELEQWLVLALYNVWFVVGGEGRLCCPHLYITCIFTAAFFGFNSGEEGSKFASKK